MYGKNLKDYRLISLVGSASKLLAKVLANIMKMMMSKLVNKAQNALLKEDILDASLLANKVIDSILKKNEKGIL